MAITQQLLQEYKNNFFLFFLKKTLKVNVN